MEKKMFGAINDTDEGLQSKSGGTFGINQGAFITTLMVNPNGGKDEEPLDVIDVTVKVGDREYRNRFFEIDKVFGKNGEITDKESDEYIKAYNALVTQTTAVLVHAAKAVGVTQAQIENEFKDKPAESLIEWAGRLFKLLPKDFKTQPIDVFLEYEWSIKDGADRTYLTLPKNMKGGYFLVPAQKGKFKEVREEEGELTYVNERGQKHPFTRSADFMSSNKAVAQFANQAAPAAATPGISGATNKSTW